MFDYVCPKKMGKYPNVEINYPPDTKISERIIFTPRHSEEIDVPGRNACSRDANCHFYSASLNSGPRWLRFAWKFRGDRASNVYVTANPFTRQV